MELTSGLLIFMCFKDRKQENMPNLLPYAVMSR